MTDLITQRLDQLPVASGVSPQAMTLVQEPGGPTEALPVSALVGRLIATATATATYNDLAAELGYPANVTALVFADPDPTKCGWYRKVGAAGGGYWSLFEILGSQAVLAAGVAMAAAQSAAARADADATAVASTYSLTLATKMALDDAVLAARPLAIMVGPADVTFDTVGLARLATILATVRSISVRGYYAPNDGGNGTWKRASADTSAHGGASFRSADRFMPDGSTDNVNGGWWILSVVNAVRVEQVGGAADCPVTDFDYLGSIMTSSWTVPTGMTDNLPAFMAACSLATIAAADGFASGYDAGTMLQILFSTGVDTRHGYYFSGKLIPPCTVNVKGLNSGFDAPYGVGTIFLYPPNVGGVLINQPSTQPAGYAQIGATGSIFEGIYFRGGGGNDRTAHGYQRRAPCSFRNCNFDSFAGDGHHNVASVGYVSTDPRFGLTSGSSDYNIMIRAAGNYGSYGDGSDMSASIFVNMHIKSARLGGLWDTGYFQNSYPGLQVNGHGYGGLGACQHNGRRYIYIDPTGRNPEPGTDETGWEDWGALSVPVAGSYDAWSSTTAYQISAPAFIGGSVLLEAPYIEDYYLPIVGRTESSHLVVGSAFVSRNTNYWYADWTVPSIRSNFGPEQLRTYAPTDPMHAVVGDWDRVQIGGFDGYLRKRERASENGLRYTEQYEGPNTRYGPGFSGSGNPTIWNETGSNTAETFGRPTPQPHRRVYHRVSIGSRSESYADARVLECAPTYNMEQGTYQDPDGSVHNKAHGELGWANDVAIGGSCFRYAMGDGTVQPIGIIGAKLIAHVPDPAGATPTSAEFKALRDAMVAAGQMAAS